MLGVVRQRDVYGIQAPTSLHASRTTHFSTPALHQPHLRFGSASTSI